MIPLAKVAASRPSARLRVAVGAAPGPLPLGAFARSSFVLRTSGARGLVAAVTSGRAAAAVRGTLEAGSFVEALGVPSAQRAVLLAPRPSSGVLLGPVGIAEGRGQAARTRFARQACALLARAGLASEPPLVAVLALGRSQDAGRGRHIARSLRESRAVVANLEREGIDAFFAGVQLEDVLTQCDVLVMPDGAAGNLAFRALHLAGGMRSFGAPVLSAPFVAVDTSRARASFEDPVRLAAHLARALAAR